MARAVRLAPGEEVSLDGVLDEAFWGRAGGISAFTQVQPVEGLPAGHGTQVLLVFDARHLYVGLRCQDDPREVRARQMDRDAFVSFDDVVELWFDTFDTQRFAYWFQITPAGSRGDALLSDGGDRFNKDWDGIWDGRARLTDEGWSAELVLPFQTLAFREGAEAWGFNVRRNRVADGERTRWASPRQAYSFFNLSRGGRLEGLEGLEQGHGVDVKPYVRLDAERTPSGESDGAGTVGLDVSWRPTSETNLRLTVNTDFAETEVDQRQLNLTRFPLFFPEKRDFFLEDAGLFEFGAPIVQRTLIPFFSRRIGRDADGEAVPIDVGGKFTGRMGPWSVGLLDTLVDDPELGQRNLGVVRVSHSLGGPSAVGAIATAGSPDRPGSAGTAGLDLHLGDPEFLGEHGSGDLWVYGVLTDGQERGSDGAFGVQARTQTTRWRHDLSLQHVGEDLDPQLGFVQRRGIDRGRYETSYTLRLGPDAPVRELGARLAVDATRDLVRDEDTWAVPLRPLRLTFQSQDSLQWEVHRIFERITQGFELGGVPVTPGEYSMTRQFLEFESNDRRATKLEATFEQGDFYGGDLLRWSVGPAWIPNAHLYLKLAYTDADVRLPAGQFRTRLAALNADWKFTPQLSWKNFAQYDTQSRDLGLQSRLHWIVRPGQDVFLVGLMGWNRGDDHGFHSLGSEAVLKLTYTLRF